MESENEKTGGAAPLTGPLTPRQGRMIDRKSPVQGSSSKSVKAMVNLFEGTSSSSSKAYLPERPSSPRPEDNYKVPGPSKGDEPTPEDGGAAEQLQILMNQLDQFFVEELGEPTAGVQDEPTQPEPNEEPPRDPKEVKKFWDNVRAQLKVEDWELDDPPFIAEQNRQDQLEKRDEPQGVATYSGTMTLRPPEPSRTPDSPFGTGPIMESLRAYYAQQELDPTTLPTGTFSVISEQSKTDTDIEDESAQLTPLARPASAFPPPLFSRAPYSSAPVPTSECQEYDSESVYSQDDSRPNSPPIPETVSRRPDVPHFPEARQSNDQETNHPLSLHRFRHLYNDRDETNQQQLQGSSDAMPSRLQSLDPARKMTEKKSYGSLSDRRRGMPLAPIVTSAPNVANPSKQSKTYKKFDFDDDDEDDMPTPRRPALSQNQDSGSSDTGMKKENRVTKWPANVPPPSTSLSPMPSAATPSEAPPRPYPLPLRSYRSQNLRQEESEQHPATKDQPNLNPQPRKISTSKTSSGGWNPFARRKSSSATGSNHTTTSSAGTTSHQPLVAAAQTAPPAVPPVVPARPLHTPPAARRPVSPMPIPTSQAPPSPRGRSTSAGVRSSSYRAHQPGTMAYGPQQTTHRPEGVAAIPGSALNLRHLPPPGPPPSKPPPPPPVPKSPEEKISELDKYFSDLEYEQEGEDDDGYAKGKKRYGRK